MSESQLDYLAKTTEILQQENAKLKAEIERLNAQVAMLRGASEQVSKYARSWSTQRNLSRQSTCGSYGMRLPAHYPTGSPSTMRNCTGESPASTTSTKTTKLPLKP